MKNSVQLLPSISLFLKKNWFSFALVGVIFLAAIRQTWKNQPAARTRENIPTERKTPTIPPDENTKYIENGTASRALDQSKFLDGSASNRLEMPELSDAAQQAFLQRFAKVAIGERQKFGIPASVILGSGLVQSFAGQRDVALEANNFFALKSAGDDGPVFSKNGKNYRRFATAWDSFRANSQFLNDHFSNLKNSDWRGWAKGLANEGYSDVKNFEEELAKVIVEFQLEKLDKK